MNQQNGGEDESDKDCYNSLDFNNFTVSMQYSK